MSSDHGTHVELTSQLQTIVTIVHTLGDHLIHLQNALKEHEGSLNPDCEAESATSDPPESPCTTCPERVTCQKPCEKLRKLLPSMSAGSSKKLITTTEVSLDLLHHHHGVRKEHAGLIYERYRACWHLLTQEQAEAVRLRFDEGMLQKDAAAKIGICPGSMSDRLKRAKQVMEEFHNDAERD